VFWVLTVLLVVVPTLVVVLLALSTKRHLKAVASDVGGSVAQVVALVDQLQQARPPAPPTCPTCGQVTPAPTATLTPAVTSRAPARSR
jgi:hypothetical protein